MKKYVMPLAIVGAILSAALTLEIVVTLRPWAGADASYHTHLNFLQVPPEDYTRTELTRLGTEIGAPSGWTISNQFLKSGEEAEDLLLYVGLACASCHGLVGEGTPAGPQVRGTSARKLTKVMRDGSGGMPPYHEIEVSDDQIELLTGFMERVGPKPEETATPKPTETPWPTATPVPPATATPMPTPTYTPTPLPILPGGRPVTLPPTATAIPTPLPGATATPEPTPLPKPDLSPEQFKTAQQLYIDVGCDLCHGALGEGNKEGPPAIGYTPTEIRDSIREGIRNPDSKWPREMKPAGEGEITDAEINIIINFLRFLEE